jgi:hypothetical protein
MTAVIYLNHELTEQEPSAPEAMPIKRPSAWRIKWEADRPNREARRAERRAKEAEQKRIIAKLKVDRCPNCNWLGMSPGRRNRHGNEVLTCADCRASYRVDVPRSVEWAIRLDGSDQ